jgi:hypothetical protein
VPSSPDLKAGASPAGAAGQGLLIPSPDRCTARAAVSHSERTPTRGQYGLLPSHAHGSFFPRQRSHPWCFVPARRFSLTETLPSRCAETCTGRFRCTALCPSPRPTTACPVPQLMPAYPTVISDRPKKEEFRRVVFMPSMNKKAFPLLFLTRN